jgi:hypothetical protein
MAKQKLMNLVCLCYKRDKQITKNNKENATETQDFNVENPSNTEEKKSRALASKTSPYRKCLQTS